MPSDTTERIRAILEEAAAAEPGSVHGDTALSTLDGWDSMGVVFFLGEVASHWPTVFLTADEVDAAKTVGDLGRLVSGKL